MRRYSTRNTLLLPERERASEGRLSLPREMQLALMEQCRELPNPLVLTAADGFVLSEDPAAKPWRDLMELLGLRAEFVLGAAEALKEDGWRRARNPRAFLNPAAIRIAERKFGLKLHKPKIVHTAALENLDCDSHNFGQRTTYQPSDSSEDEHFQSAVTKNIGQSGERYGIYDARNIPFRLMQRDSNDNLVPNWAAIAYEMRRAGFTREDINHYILKTGDLTREEIQALAKTDDERRSLQAAEKSFQRKRRKFVLEVLRPRDAPAPKRQKPLLKRNKDGRENYDQRTARIHDRLTDLYLLDKRKEEDARNPKRGPVKPPVVKT